MNVQSNTYTFIYAVVMVIIVAVGLSLTSISLKNRQQSNIEKEKKQSILKSIGIECTRDQAVDLFSTYVKNVYAIDYQGQKIDGVDAFSLDLAVEQAKSDETQRYYPVFECENNGTKLNVFPVRGKGLWGPIWGFVALEGDFNTVYGVTFDHKSETPGLGAEITTADFQAQFVGKQIFNDLNEFVSILVKKPAQYNPNDLHEVQGFSGSTLTCNGLQDMLENSLKPYEKFFLSHQ
ncbi:MAG: NADH:ubiquinone reductase (Na(+)-transporting) subunit C [Bacteroidales bacterium]|nr:NADH:ubiquinone reductase (Na(+)-transporting) subunit C [Bacteroidales bacterium]